MMSHRVRWRRLRAWLNRDNGRLIRLGNRPLRALELTGLLALVAAFVVHLVAQKTAADLAVPALLLALVGMVLLLANALLHREDFDS